MRHEVIDNPVQLISLPNFDAVRGRKTLTVSASATIGEMVAIARKDLKASDRARLYVTVNGAEIPAAIWHRVRAKPGTAVIIRHPVPKNDTLRNVLSVVVLVAAVALGQLYAPALAGSVLGAAFPAGITGYGALSATAATTGIIGAGITLGVSLAGSFLVNALIPIRGASSDKPTDVYSITGLQNSANPGGVIPSILAKHRYAPPYAATPYTEIVGDDQYVIALFVLGHGPLALSDHKLGETPIDQFEDVQMEIREGYPDDDPISIYHQQVIEDQVSVQLTYNTPVIRLSPRDVTELSVDFAFVQGLVQYDKNGSKKDWTVSFQIQHRLLGDADWTPVYDLSVTAADQKLIRRSYRWAVPVRGQYEIKITRSTEDSTDSKIVDRSDLAAVRGFRPEYPINFDKPLALVALRIRASNQLNGVVNNYNCIASLLCRDYDAASDTWIVRETSNSASLYRHVMQGPANVNPKADDEIDLAQLEDWHAFNVSRNLKYNRVHDYDATRLEVLADVAGVGRAVPHDDGETWGVIIDRPQTIQVAALSPRNAWDFQGATPYVKLPDAFRCQFIDETNGYAQAERIVPFPGVNIDEVEITEDLAHPGITDPDLIWIESRRRQYEVLHRRSTYTCSQDFESMVLTRGNLAALSSDVLDREQVAGRVKAISGQTVTLDTAVTMEEGANYACKIRLADGTILRRTVATQAGEVWNLAVVGDLSGVATGDLFMFGEAVRGETIDVIVKAIERGDNLTGKFTLYDAAPEIDELTAAEVPPAWDGRVGQIIDFSGLPPDVPVPFRAQYAQGKLSVSVRPGPDLSKVSPASYVVAHRLQGGGAFTEVSFPVANGAVAITGYAIGNSIEVKAKAVSFAGAESAYSDIVVVDAAQGPFVDNINITADSINLKADSF
ncbi:host specificity factor TipJ family phage tail protein [Mesorhizobium sp.]|uniref:host specificity factor TipJ family phage tail protein n=1 Tax=Mesorhizobium sp. TaxID=1871066 RepID=UPI0025F470DB|nr:host specificity factor TipJ family phage tail protein [Mesorhizobium sp.]